MLSKAFGDAEVEWTVLVCKISWDVSLGLFMVHLVEQRSLSALEGMDRNPRKTTGVRILCDVISFS